MTTGGFGWAWSTSRVLCRGCEDVAIYCDSRHVSHLRDGRFLVSEVTFPPRGLQKQSGVAIFGLVNDMSESRPTAEPLLIGSAASGHPALPWAVYELFSSNFESISRRTNVYLQQSFATRFPVHDGMIHGWAIEHQRSPEGLVLSRYGFEHCLFTLLLRSGRPVGTATVTRRTGRPPFTSQELAVARRLGGFLSIALANAVTHTWARPVAEPLAPPSWSDGDTQTLRLDDLRAGEHDPAAGAGFDVTEVLTKREREVLVLAMSGLQNAEIAIDLGIATNTAKQHEAHLSQDRCAFSPRFPWLPPERAMRTLIPRSRRYPLGIVGRSPIAGGAHDETRH
jgi:DNA-binding CsgD family transcriptional regulator